MIKENTHFRRLGKTKREPDLHNCDLNKPMTSYVYKEREQQFRLIWQDTFERAGTKSLISSSCIQHFNVNGRNSLPTVGVDEM
uniref:Uncharacterized protein n=1 Tax=Solanum lycopersicum TaxID=4081 RepID=A0A3Q7EUM6_SOLLC